MVHRYNHPDTGKPVVPSVTEIIKDCSDKSQALTKWAAWAVVEYIKANCQPDNDIYHVSASQLQQAATHFNEVSQIALDVGSTVHKLIEQWLKGDQPREIQNVQIRAGFEAFLKFAEAHDIETIRTEHRVIGKNPLGLLFGGTLDWLCCFNKPCDNNACDCGLLAGLPTVVDFKTSKAIYPEMAYQVAAYRFCVETEFDSGAGAILRLDKETGIPELSVCTKYYNDISVFFRMVDLFYTKHPRIAKAVNGYA